MDALGNVIAPKKGAGDRKVMLAAHMDEIGFMVRYIDDQGFVRIQPLGGFDARVLVAQRAVIHTRSGERLRGVVTPATKPIHLMGDEKPGAPKLEEFYIDLGLPSIVSTNSCARRFRDAGSDAGARWGQLDRQGDG